MAPGNAAARTLDSHHTFTVEYRPEQDRGLSMHEDDAHVLCWSCDRLHFESACKPTLWNNDALKVVTEAQAHCECFRSGA